MIPTLKLVVQDKSNIFSIRIQVLPKEIFYTFLSRMIYIWGPNLVFFQFDLNLPLFIKTFEVTLHLLIFFIGSLNFRRDFCAKNKCRVVFFVNHCCFVSVVIVVFLLFAHVQNKWHHSNVKCSLPVTLIYTCI